MKTAEDWALEHGAYKKESIPGIWGYCEFSASTFSDVVKAIQLDAYKAGMTEAANVPCNTLSNDLRSEGIKALRKAILTARNKKKI